MCIVTMKTMTSAIKGRKALFAAGVEGDIVSLDKNLTKNGCAYGVAFPCSAATEVERILKARSVSYGEIIGAGY